MNFIGSDFHVFWSREEKGESDEGKKGGWRKVGMREGRK